jgi:hypothetical protein
MYPTASVVQKPDNYRRKLGGVANMLFRQIVSKVSAMLRPGTGRSMAIVIRRSLPQQELLDAIETSFKVGHARGKRQSDIAWGFERISSYQCDMSIF